MQIMRNKIRTITSCGLVALCLALTGCATSATRDRVTRHRVAYRPAINISKQPVKKVIKYVPVPLPGQLIKIGKHKRHHKHSIAYIRSHMTGIAAIKMANRKALQRPATQSYMNSIMTFDYMPGALYQVYCAPLRVTDIQFQLGETIYSVAAGDTMRWQVSKTYSGEENARVQHLLIKPVQADLTTSLVVTTDRRTYHFTLHSTQDTYMAAIKWRYPTDEFVTAFHNISTTKSAISQDNLALHNLDFNYRMRVLAGRKPRWMPTMAFNDGYKTYVKFPQNMQEAPILFIGNKNSIIVTNYRTKGNYYIIDKVVYNMQLRLGQKHPTIVQINYYKN
jgi:type IV secretion system protein TrbG